ncbi:hypothetical protein EMIT0P176_20274 [Pseudomonas sp. IT-P176]
MRNIKKAFYLFAEPHDMRSVLEAIKLAFQYRDNGVKVYANRPY